MIMRREFITILGGAAAAWPLRADAQQLSTPIIGHLHPASLEGSESTLAGFRQGLKEEGFVEGRNVAIDYRWAHGEFARVPALMADLARSRIDVLAVFGTAVRVVKTAQAEGIARDIPVVFSFGGDPVAIGLVASLNRPGGNITGSTSIGVELGPKRLELVRAVVPTADSIALLTNPTNPGGELERKDIENAAHALGWRLHVISAERVGEFDAAFATVAREHIGALIIAVDTFFYGEMTRLASLAAKHGVPTIGPLREFASAGGLVSFGANIPDVVRQAGVYVGKVLKGANPANLPILQPTKFELVINLRAAKSLGLTIPLALHVAADEVIE